MERSIESIWKEGFLKGDALVAPKVNNLFDRKSKDLVDKMKGMFSMNYWYLIGLAAFILIVGAVLGFPVMGAGWSILIVVLIVAARSESRKLQAVDKGVSSYSYLRSFKEWLDNAFARYGRIYRFFYPAFFFFFVIGAWFSRYQGKFLDKLTAWDPDLTILLGMPHVVWLIALIGTMAMPLLSGALYRLDVWLMYGKVFKKLDEIIADMEELRA